MKIKVEFNPDLALRDYSEFKKGNRLEQECVPNKLEIGREYTFLKKGQKNYCLEEEIPLLITKDNEKISRPIASVRISESIHFLREKNVWTKGTYQIKKILGNDKE